jgi:hypothetical protein
MSGAALRDWSTIDLAVAEIGPALQPPGLIGADPLSGRSPSWSSDQSAPSDHFTELLSIHPTSVRPPGLCAEDA